MKTTTQCRKDLVLAEDESLFIFTENRFHFFVMNIECYYHSSQKIYFGHLESCYENIENDLTDGFTFRKVFVGESPEEIVRKVKNFIRKGLGFTITGLGYEFPPVA